MNEGEIAISLGMSRGLVKEYMEIIKEHEEDRKVISWCVKMCYSRRILSYHVPNGTILIWSPKKNNSNSLYTLSETYGVVTVVYH